MRKKPKGRKYRNLVQRGAAIYYESVVDGSRIRFSTETSDWDQAAAVRDLYEMRRGIGKLPLRPADIPTFEEFAERYLDEDTQHLVRTTKHERRSLLRAGGPILGALGPRPLGEISEATLREWWGAEIERAGRSTKTGRNYLDAISSVLHYAHDLGLIERNPVAGFRQMLGRRLRTQQGRADATPGRDVSPIASATDVDRLVAEAKAEGPTPYLFALLLLDAGLRVGEALGLRYGCAIWGDDNEAPRRALAIEESRPRGGSPGLTKSGRARRVAMSMRLREALSEAYRTSFAPGPRAHVLPDLDPSNFRKREWRRILKRADIGRIRLKDLRDTYASQLLTCGVPLGYVSAQLGHADVSVTARHYARWVESDFYRVPLVLEPGEVPADFLARLPKSPHRPPTSEGMLLRDGLSTLARKFDDVFSAAVMQPDGGFARHHRAWRAGGVDRGG